MNDKLTILQGDCRDVLRTLPDESVHCCVTSPPYWQQRDYQAAGQIGLEPTPSEYIEKLVAVFAEVRRVLRTDGVLWINVGDTYAKASGPGWQGKNGQRADRRFTLVRDTVPMREASMCPPENFKPKDLIGVPWRLAFALQEDGWWLRQDIIWSKPAPMPESVADRCTKSHDYLFLLAKSERYYFNQDAIKEPASPDSHARYARGRSENHKYVNGGPGGQTIARTLEHMRKPGVNPKCSEPGSGVKQNSSFSAVVKDLVETRNKRSVWTVNTAGYSEAHFATFPPARKALAIFQFSRCSRFGRRFGIGRIAS